jgi:HEAT repeat protein
MASGAESALPALRRALEDEDDEVRREARKAIQRVAGDD